MSNGLTLEQYERLNPRCEVPFEGGSVFYVTPTSQTRWRVDTLFDKEPDTIAWIASFAPSDILVDIGANVGMYTVWAAKTRGVRVFAFEPESQNFALLNRNLVGNQLSGRVSAYCAALSDRNGWSELHLSAFEMGGSCHSLGEKVDFNHVPMVPAWSQGCVSVRLDDLIAQGVVQQPTHIKIDVDGFEPKVIAGAANAIADPRLQSLLIEVNQNLADHIEMVKSLEARGFRWDPAQIARAERKSGIFKGCAEYVFRR
jgi:FkbM family methyltransferase